MNRRHLFYVACAGLFLFGAIIALLGTLFGLPETRARLQINLAEQGDLFSLLFVGLLAATVLTGPAIDRFGTKLVLGLSSLTAALGLAGFAVAEGFASAAVGAVVLGAGGAGLNTTTNVVVSDLYPEDRGRMLNVLGMFFGAGALFVPLLKTSAFGLLPVGGLVGVTVLLAIGCALACLLMPFPPPREAAGASLRELVRAATYPGVLVFAALLFFQSGNEASMSGWITTYIGGRGWPARTATGILAGYWAAVIVGRSIAARLVRTIGKRRLVIGSALASMAGCALLMASPTLGMLIAGALVTSLSFSGIFPTTLAMVGDRYRRHAGTVFGFLFTVSAVGNMVSPGIVGHLSQVFGVRVGMVVPLVGAGLVAAISANIRTEAER